MKKDLLLMPVMLLSGIINAQTPQTVSIGAGYTDQVWYSLLNGVQQTRPAAEWDLAFEISGFTASILANTQKAGFMVYRSPYAMAQWSTLDSAGLAGWPVLHNADTSWSRGAFNQTNTADEFDLGWGLYNSITHVVTGDSVQVIHLANGEWKKIRIDALTTGIYSFIYANLDGSAEQSVQINKADYAGKNFAYWSLEANTAIDREPPTAEWDLTFCKYVAFIPDPYGVTGALHNKGVEAARIAGLPPDEATHDGAVFSSWINTIGHDWKYFDMGTFTYVIDDSLTYYVKDVPGNIWKVVFMGFGGSATGEMSFTKELVSAAQVNDLQDDMGRVIVLPNPVEDGNATLVMDLPAGELVLTIFDMTGRVLQQERTSSSGVLAQRMLDLHGLGSGTYGLRLAHDHGSVSTRFIVR